jgi:Kef-type K+ transport system membrane component KefB
MITLSMEVLSDVAGLGSLFGALIAGIIVRNTLKSPDGGEQRIWESHILTRSVHTISFGFLVPLVFVWAGLNLNIGALMQELPLVGFLVVVAIVGMVLGSIIGVLLNKGTLKEGVLVGFGLSPKGDVELAIATLALSNGIITQNIFAAIIGMAIITTIISPLIFKRLLKTWGEELKAVTTQQLELLKKA